MATQSCSSLSSYFSCAHRDLHSFPTRRSSDLMSNALTTAQALLGDTAPKLAELTDNVLFGDVWERPGLSKRSEEHTSELQSHSDLVCRLLLEKKKQQNVRKSIDVDQRCAILQF